MEQPSDFDQSHSSPLNPKSLMPHAGDSTNIFSLWLSYNNAADPTSKSYPLIVILTRHDFGREGSARGGFDK
jgi:hypothetical protein